MLAACANQVRKIYQELGWEHFEENALPSLQAHVDDIKDYKKNSFEPLTDAQRRAVNRHWGPAFETWGYDMIGDDGEVHLHGH